MVLRSRERERERLLFLHITKDHGSRSQQLFLEEFRNLKGILSHHGLSRRHARLVNSLGRILVHIFHDAAHARNHVFGIVRVIPQQDQLVHGRIFEIVVFSLDWIICLFFSLLSLLLLLLLLFLLLRRGFGFDFWLCLTRHEKRRSRRCHRWCSRKGWWRYHKGLSLNKQGQKGGEKAQSLHHGDIVSSYWFCGCHGGTKRDNVEVQYRQRQVLAGSRMNLHAEWNAVSGLFGPARLKYYDHQKIRERFIHGLH